MNGLRLILLAGAFWVAAAPAAELGPIRLHSGMGQPLSAEIAVAHVQPNEFELLAVRLAAPEFFSQAGLKHLTALNRLNLRVVKKPDGAVVIALSTREPIHEPVLAFLLEFYSAHGHVLREYTVLLDAERMLAAEKAALAAEAPQSAQAALAAAPGTHEYGPVQQGESLRSIARQSIPVGASEAQALAALYTLNPKAFEGGNINRLRRGVRLSLPAADEIAAFPAHKAAALVQRHNAEWLAWRDSLAAAPAEDSAEAATGKVQAAAAQAHQAAPAAVGGDKLHISTPADAERLSQLEEEVAAKQHTLDEAEARIAELEKVVADMQHLMELKLKQEQESAHLRPWLIWGGAALALLAVLAGGLWFWRRKKAAKPRTEKPKEAVATEEKAPEKAAVEEKPAVVPPQVEVPAEVVPLSETPAAVEGPLDLSGIDLDLNVPAEPAAAEAAPSEADLAALAAWEAMAAEAPTAAATAAVAEAAASTEPEPSAADKAALAEWEAMLAAQEGGEAVEAAAAESPVETRAEVASDEAIEEAATEAATEAVEAVATEAAAPEGGDDYTMQASFELARAYIEVGDVEGAREVLTEVVQRGNEAEQQEAMRMLGELG